MWKRKVGEAQKVPSPLAPPTKSCFFFNKSQSVCKLVPTPNLFVSLLPAGLSSVLATINTLWDDVVIVSGGETLDFPQITDLPPISTSCILSSN